MAKEKEIKQEETLDPRQAAWEKFLENYATKNPVKFAKKKARGEFDTIPASFRG